MRVKVQCKIEQITITVVAFISFEEYIINCYEGILICKSTHNDYLEVNRDSFLKIFMNFAKEK